MPRLADGGGIGRGSRYCSTRARLTGDHNAAFSRHCGDQHLMDEDETVTIVRSPSAVEAVRGPRHLRRGDNRSSERPMPARSMTKKKPMNEVTRERWLAKLAKLKIDLKGNPAPHKPLLLLVVIELAEQGLLPKGTFPLTPEIAFRFCTYWSIVAHRRTQKPDVRYPFHHMQSGGFWKALGRRRKPIPGPTTDTLCGP